MILYAIIGAIIGGAGGFLLALAKRAHEPVPAAAEGAEQTKPDRPRSRVANALGTALIGVAFGGFVGYMAYDLKGFAYKRSDQIIEISAEQQFDKLVANSSKPVLVDFYIVPCDPCARMAPVISEIADETKGRALVLSVDGNTQTELAQRFGANQTGFPLFVIIHNGRETARYIGVTDKQALLEKMKDER